jgi:hypothetical protein
MKPRAEDVPAAPVASTIVIPGPRVEHETVRELRIETHAPALDRANDVRREVVELTTLVERHTRELRETELRELVVETMSPPGAPVTLEAPQPRSSGTAVTPLSRVVAAPVSPSTRAAIPRPIAEPTEEPAAVRVTIGRVEVRAVFPAAAPAAQSKSRPAPVMPLDEYLKQGNRRGR